MTSYLQHRKPSITSRTQKKLHRIVALSAMAEPRWEVGEGSDNSPNEDSR